MRSAMVAANANLLFPSISAWLCASECSRAAAISSTVE